jgi:hypothetical protein
MFSSFVHLRGDFIILASFGIIVRDTWWYVERAYRV